MMNDDALFKHSIHSHWKSRLKKAIWLMAVIADVSLNNFMAFMEFANHYSTIFSSFGIVFHITYNEVKSKDYFWNFQWTIIWRLVEINGSSFDLFDFYPNKAKVCQDIRFILEVSQKIHRLILELGWRGNLNLVCTKSKSGCYYVS